jgi:hypothetical protein
VAILYYALLGAPLLAVLVANVFAAEDDESPWSLLVVLGYVVSAWSVSQLWGDRVALYAIAGTFLVLLVVSWVDGFFCRRLYGKDYELY